jgi:hypothetical protein
MAIDAGRFAGSFKSCFWIWLAIHKQMPGTRSVAKLLWLPPRRRFSFGRGLSLSPFSSRRRLDFPSLLLSAFEYLNLAPPLFFERAPLVFVPHVYFFRRRRRSRPLYSLPVLQRLAVARLLHFELALFSLFTATNLFGGRSWGSPRRFELARRSVCRLPFNPGAIEDNVAASDFDAAAWRATVRNALARYGAA